MSENIEKAKTHLEAGATDKAIDDFFSAIHELKMKGEYEETAKLLLEVMSIADESGEPKLFLQTIERFIEEEKDLKLSDFTKFYKEVSPFLDKATTIFRTTGDRLDIVGEISETLAKYQQTLGENPSEYLLDAANSYGQWAIRVLARRSRIREEETKASDEYIEKAAALFQQAGYEEPIIAILLSLSEKYLEYKNEEGSEKALDKATDYFLKAKFSGEELTKTAEKVIEGFVYFAKYKISNILDPEKSITKNEEVLFDENPAIPVIKRAREVCTKSKAISVVNILAEELTLIALAIFEKGFHSEALPYFEMARDYYSELGDRDELLKFSNNLIALGLELYSNENYPIGRDYFSIAVDIGRKIDQTFVISIYQKQIERYIKNKNYQLAIEVYRQILEPLLALPDSSLREDIPSEILQLARERFEKNDFHYADQMYRLCATFFIELGQVDLAAETLDSAWQPMFQVRQLQTGIDLASKAAETYINAGKEEEAADVYLKLAIELFAERHYDIALERLKLTAETIPEELREQKFEPLVKLTIEQTEICLNSRDIINAKELWKAVCEFNEIWAGTLLQRDVNMAVEIIEEHIKVVRKLDNPELNEETMESALRSGKLFSEAGENERAAKILVSFATDFLRKDLTQYAEPLFEQGANEFKIANQPEEAARVLTALARYHSDHGDYEKSFKYYLMASIESDAQIDRKIFLSVAEHCFETAITRLKEENYEIAEKTFEITVRISSAVDWQIAASQAHEIAMNFFKESKIDFALKYYKSSIEILQSISLQDVIRIAAETIERGREIFSQNMLSEANDFISLGIETLVIAEQKVQAAQTARIEGERFLGSDIPSIGLNLLSRAIEIFGELNDQESMAEVFLTLGNCFISDQKVEEGLAQYSEAGDTYLEMGHEENLRKVITKCLDTAVKIVEGKMELGKEEEGKLVELAEGFFGAAEDFSLKMGDEKLNGEIKFREWLTYSKARLHEQAYESLKITYKAFVYLENFDRVSIIAASVSDFAAKLISENDLINATKYLNLSIEILKAIDRDKEAAGICISTCEEYLEQNNYEVAVSWGIRGAEILTETNKVDEAILFLEEAAEQLMEINSIENAILCYGKIAKIYEKEGKIKEVEAIALKVMSFGTAYMKSSDQEAGLRLWEVTRTIGAVVGYEFTGRLASIEAQTFFEIKEYQKAIGLFKDSLAFFNREEKIDRMTDLGNSIFSIVEELQKEKEYDVAFEMAKIAFEALIAAKELYIAADMAINNAKNFIAVGREEEGLFLINAAITTLFTNKEIPQGVEKCLIGASILISYGNNTEGSKLIDRGMERISQINDPTAIKDLAAVCRNQGTLLREEDKLAASHIILATGIGILRTINDLVSIGEISIDLGKTLIKRDEINAAVEAYRNGVKYLVEGGRNKEALDVINELLTEGRKQVDTDNIPVGIPLVELAGELFIYIKHYDRIMMISEIFINQGGKMLNEQNYDIAALFFSKAMELSTEAGLKEYLPKVGNRCIDFGLKLLRAENPILGFQFMNAGAEIIAEYEQREERTERATSNFLEAVNQLLTSSSGKSEEEKNKKYELVGQIVDSAFRFFAQIESKKSLERLAGILIDYGSQLLKSEDLRLVRRIFEPALSSTMEANNTELQVKIADIYLDHVSYLAQVNKFEYLDTTINQALNIYLEVGDLNEIRKFLGVISHIGREMCLDRKTISYGIKIITTASDLAATFSEKDFFVVVVIPCIQLDQQATELEDFELAIFARQCIIRLLNAILNANFPLSILGTSIDFSSMVRLWHQAAEPLITKAATFDQAIKIEDQALQLAVITQQVDLGLTIIDEILEKIDDLVRKKMKGVDILYEILAIALNGLDLTERVQEIGRRCMEIGITAAEKRRREESISFLKSAGRIFAVIGDEKLIAELAITSARIGDQRLRENNFKEGLHYYSTALENYELSHDEEKIQIIVSSIEDLFERTPPEDGYVCFLVPAMVYANRGRSEEAAKLAARAIELAGKMIETKKIESVFHSIRYTFAAADIYEAIENFREEIAIYDSFMFRYLEAINDSKVVNLFIDLLIRSIIKKLLTWDFTGIDNLFKQIDDQRILKAKKYQAIGKSIETLKEGKIAAVLQHASDVNVLFERSIQEFIDSYQGQIKTEIVEKGKINIHHFKEGQPVSQLINLLIQDLFARKEIAGKYFPRGLFVSSSRLNVAFEWCDKELVEKGKAAMSEIINYVPLTIDEAVTIIRREFLPRKFQATFNEDESVLYSYRQLRNEVGELALEYQEIGNIDINKISEQMRFPPEIIQREVEYLILEGKINPRLVERK